MKNMKSKKVNIKEKNEMLFYIFNGKYNSQR